MDHGSYGYNRDNGRPDGWSSYYANISNRYNEFDGKKFDSNGFPSGIVTSWREDCVVVWAAVDVCS